MKKFTLIILTLLVVLLSQNVLAVEVTSPNAILIDIESGKILYEKDAYSMVYPASTTKVLTAIMALESCNLNDTATASYNAVMSVPYDGTTAAIQVGETWTIEQLVQAMMVCSANEAANIIAEHIGGSTESFATMMNTRAKELGAKTTNFVNANGLHSDKHYTTVYDMAMITRYGMLNVPEFKKIANQKKFSLPNTSFYDKGDRNFTTTNKIIDPSSSYYYEYATGIKTGYTSKALNCIVASAEKDGVELIVVVFGAQGASARTADVKELFNYGFEQLKSESFIAKGETVEELKVSGAKSEDDLLVAVTSKNIVHTIPADKSASDYTPEISFNKDLKAPINAGDTVGTISYDIEGNTYKYDLVASNNIDSMFNSVATVAVKTTKAILKIVFWSALSVVGIFIGLVLLRASIIKKRQRMRARRRAIYNKRFR